MTDLLLGVGLGVVLLGIGACAGWLAATSDRHAGRHRASALPPCVITRTVEVERLVRVPDNLAVQLLAAATWREQHRIELDVGQLIRDADRTMERITR